MPKTKGLTIKQKKFAYKYVQVGDASEAARFASPKAKSIGQLGYQQLQNPNVQAEIERIFDEDLGRPLNKDLANIAKWADATEFKDLPTPETSLRASELLLKVRGAFQKNNINLNLSFSAKLDKMTTEDAKEALQQLQDRSQEVLSDIE